MRTWIALLCIYPAAAGLDIFPCLTSLSWPGSPNPQLCATPAWTRSLTCACSSSSCNPSLSPACCAVYRASKMEKIQGEDLLPVKVLDVGSFQGFLSAQGWSAWLSNLPRPGTGHRLCSIRVMEEEKPAVLTLQSPLLVRTADRSDHRAPREMESGSAFWIVKMKALNISCTQVFSLLQAGLTARAGAAP